ncbi:MAG: IPTL-CTERM sorting domain-containing protein [Usitatibacter sp.]
MRTLKLLQLSWLAVLAMLALPLQAQVVSPSFGTITFTADETTYLPGTSPTLHFHLQVATNGSIEFVDNVIFTFPVGVTVVSAAGPSPFTACANGQGNQSTAAQVARWDTPGHSSGCGAFANGNFNFNVTVSIDPAFTGTLTVVGRVEGDGFGGTTTNINQNIDLASAVVTSYTAPSATGTGNITASFTGGGAACTFNSPAYINVTGDPGSPPPGSAPAGVTFPHGLFDFDLTGCTPGSTITMTMTYPTPLPTRTYWKYGPTPGNPAAHWYVMPSGGAGNTLTFSITDGGLGDDDLTANGTIVDQGGPGVGAAVAANVPTMSEWMMIVMAGLMLLFGMQRVSRRR